MVKGYESSQQQAMLYIPLLKLDSRSDENNMKLIWGKNPDKVLKNKIKHEDFIFGNDL